PIKLIIFRKVFLATKTDSTRLYAVKILSKEEMKRKNLVDKTIRASDVLNTPSFTNLPVEFYRTPGQLISLTTELSFAHSPVKNPVPKLDELSFSSSNYPNENTLPERHENVGDTAFNSSVCLSNQMAPERLTFDLTSQLDHDAKERLLWRQHILQQIQTIDSNQDYGSLQHVANSPSLSSPKPGHGQKAISLSEVIHEGSLLTLTELFAGAEPQETDAINAFLIKFPESELLRVGLLVRQLSMPIFCSPPLRNHDLIDTSDSFPKLPQASSLGPLRRCKSYSQPETRMPYRTHRIRRLCPLPWSPTMIKETSVTSLNSFRLTCFNPYCHVFCLIQRALLPPLPHCPEQQDSDDAMESEKENVRTDFANVDSGSRDNTDAQSKIGLPQPATMFGSPKWPPLSVPTTSSSPQTVVSPLRGELVHLNLTPHLRQSISPEPVVPTVSPSVQFTNSPLTSDAFRLATTPSMFATMAHRTGPEVPLSSVEKIRLQQLYSPAPLSVEDLRYGLNLAEVDPAHPYMPCLAGSPQLCAQTPLRTPRLLRRHSSNAGLKTHPCHFPTASYKAPLESSTLMVNRINPQYSFLQRLHFDSGSDKNTPLSVIPETANPHATDRSFHNTVRFMNPCRQPCAPPSSPVTSAVCDSVARFCCANPRLLGTPEYIAPELLTQSAAGDADTPETPAVDWWSLGVILFEMLTGSTPFADETPGAVFQNILNLDIPWPCKSSGSNCSMVPSSDDQFDPEELSSDAVELISALLVRSPSERLQTASRLRTFHFLSAVGDWSRLDQMEMPFVPCPEDSTDTSYFHVRNELNAYDLTTSGTDLTFR
ncbi:serine/threonine-protein kinase greatwall, partial [Paragonimus westermani]